jgi:hypothetical protein
MSGTRFGVTPQLPAQITGTYPIVVTKSGLAYVISFGYAPLAATVTRRQWFSAVAQLYNMNTLATAVNADMNVAASIQYYAGYGVTPSDDLATLTKSTFALTDAQMEALFTLAATKPA